MTSEGAGRQGMLNFRVTHPYVFTHGICGRKDCYRGSPAAADCEFHGNAVRDIIRSRRDQRRARLQQRCRAHSGSIDMTPAAATASTSTSRNVTPLRRQPSQSSSISKPDSPLSFTSSEFSADFSPCVSPLMEDLMLEVTDAIESSGQTPELLGMPPRRTTSAFNMDDIFRMIDEAQREYESLGESPVTPIRSRNEIPRQPRWSWESLLGPS
ncbi:hypothetical protein BDP55DRAFT_186757 [Colletotrichum godetiae]|uniref:Uncharacterized protein n=1 Tax=Colletotrichum godetiae TaxID=1209918 RepID=A0AAJ0AJL4_9PEZI|nr:uncharacterized protein BDP55DRAFT_186757 [Colletotrichum godetiae]KAK1674435.1 hypothetical protein BDP55DRAFT_186757 [Colletotrichum godetiae]